MKEKNIEIIIVGSGAGGATLAKELSKIGKKVLVIEKGPYIRPLGSNLASITLYDGFGLFTKSKEGILIYKASMGGGTTIVSCANAVRVLENELKSLGIELEKEFKETEKELGVAPIDNKLISPHTKKIMQAAKELGYLMEPMTKFINAEKCLSCGNCVLGCKANAKWTALNFLEEAKQRGVSILANTRVTNILSSGGQVKGIEAISPQGKITIYGNIVILAAGAIETAIILQNSGISKAGNMLFCDLFKVVYGTIENNVGGYFKEPSMSVINQQFHKREGFILAPFLDTPFSLKSAVPLRHFLKTCHRNTMFGIMVKIKDDCVGKVHSNGTIEKFVTPNDSIKLEKGCAIAKEILIKTGAKSKSIMITITRGAHPGGTAAIGKVVNINQETEIKNLFISDASVLPEAPGLPPILTLIALSKRLSKQLVIDKE